jgi:hypothetical protein
LRRRRGARVVAGLAVALIASTAALGSGVVAGASAHLPARRVLVFSMPYVSWSDLDAVSMPNLERFLARAAVAGLSTRVDARETPLVDGYATIGAGTRTIGTPSAVVGGRMAGEPYGTATAADTYAQRTGRRAAGAIVQPAIVVVRDTNDALDYDSHVGALADRLRRAGVARAVIANGDGRAPGGASLGFEEMPGPAHQRSAVLGLMDGTGQVERGRVDRGLLEADPRAPFGVRFDNSLVVEAFGSVWRGRAVVLVEASDLVRAARAEPLVSARTHERQVVDALRRSDELFGALLDRVDLARDVVVVLGPAHEPGRVTLTPLAIRGPSFAPGLLESATTRRAGFVQLHDIAPTVLAALGLDRPTSMEGRAAVVGASGGTPRQRLEFIREADAAAQFRDARIGEVYGVLTVATATVVALVLLASRRSSAGRRHAAALAALWSLGLLSGAFLVRVVPVHEIGVLGAHAGLLGVGALTGGIAYAIGRRRPLDALVGALVLIVVVLTADAVRGAPWVLNSVLGYSPTVAGRFAGFGNPAYAAFAAAALVAAVLIAHRVGGRRGHLVAGGFLAAALVVDVAPMWGADVGGILSLVPAYAVTMIVMTGRRVRPWTAAALVAGVAAVATAVALVDFARPAERRTHLGRLVERVRDNGIGEGWSVIERKLAANLESVGTSILGLVLVIAVVGGIVLWRQERARITTVLGRVPELRAGCAGFAVLAVLGFALNDSGMTVPGIMLVVFVATWGYLLVTVAADGAAEPHAAEAGVAVGVGS